MKHRPSSSPSFAAPMDAAEALRHHDILKTHMARLRPECVREVPRFAAGLSLSAWRALLVAMDASLSSRGVLARFADDHFRAALPDGRACELGLVNLAARCRGLPEREIPARVEAHVQSLLGSEVACPPTAEELTYETVAPKLIAQVFREEALGPARERVLARPLCDGLVSVLSVDLGFGIASISRSVVEPWGRPEDALFRLGRENLRLRPVERISMPGDVLGGFMLYADDIALCAQVQILSAHLGRHLRAGALVAMPSRHTLLCVPMKPGGWDEVGPHLAKAVQFVDGFFKDVAVMTRGEAVFSPDMYWWRDGRLHAFPARLTGEGAMVMPPEAFFDAVLAPSPARDVH